jgi:DNA polymerase III psi subunit
MIDVLMLSNKSQDILSQIGIPLFIKDNTKLSIKQESTIHYYQKDSILTLHLISVDEYPEKEINLLEAIIGSIKGNDSNAKQGNYSYLEGEHLNLEKIVEENNPIKAALIFFDAQLITTNMEFIASASLVDMLANPALKKDLWAQIKPLTQN